MDLRDTSPFGQNQSDVGTRIITSAICMDEALAEMIKVEITKMKKSLNEFTLEEISSINTLLKNTIAAMIITSDKIEAGINLMKHEK